MSSKRAFEIKRCQTAKEMSGTIAFVSSLRFSFVKPVKAAHNEDALFFSIGLCTPCIGRGFKIIKFLFYL